MSSQPKHDQETVGGNGWSSEWSCAGCDDEFWKWRELSTAGGQVIGGRQKETFAPAHPKAHTNATNVGGTEKRKTDIDGTSPTC